MCSGRMAGADGPEPTCLEAIRRMLCARSPQSWLCRERDYVFIQVIFSTFE